MKAQLAFQSIWARIKARVGSKQGYRLLLLVIALLLVLQPTLGPVGIAQRANTPAGQDSPLIPAPPTGGPRPSIALNPGHGYAGQSITISGQGVEPYPGVRVAWLIDDATLTAAILDLDASGAYSTILTVPSEAEPGAAQVCAAVTGAELAEFACASFTVDTPPAGTVHGQLPLSTASGHEVQPQQSFDAVYVLYDASGVEAASAPVNQDGSFTITGVAPGTYQGVLVGSAPMLVEATTVDVYPAAAINISPELLTVQECLGVQPDVAVSAITASPNGPPAGGADFGTYISGNEPGLELWVAFDVHLQQRSGSSANLLRIEFYITDPENNPMLIGVDDGQDERHWAQFNAQALMEGTSTLWVVPVLDDEEACVQRNFGRIEAIANPMADSAVRDGQITWNSNTQSYDFEGTMPNVSGLPIVYPDPSQQEVPLLGTLENKLDAGIHYEGSMELDGTVHLRVVMAQALAKVLGWKMYEKSDSLLPSNSEQVIQAQTKPEAIQYKFGPHTLYQAEENLTVYKGVLCSFWGIVSVNASVSIGVKGELILEGTLHPLMPQLEATLMPAVTPSITISIWIDILFGVFSAGADATVAVTFGLPLKLKTSRDPPFWLDDPCIRLRIWLDVWARVNLLFWKKKWDVYSYELVNWATDSCPGLMLASAKDATPSPPRVMASPALASGPDGQMLSVYIEDTTPEVMTPTMKVMARFWDPVSDEWGTATPLTDGSHAVQDPVAAFVGPEGFALAVWTENTMSLEEDEAAGDDLAAILARQEIFYTLWNGYSWEAPSQLTDDELPDGRAALTRTTLGATLAWVRDTDGDIETRTDWRIATSDWDHATQTWGAIQLLDASSALQAANQDPTAQGPNPQASGAMNAQVSAAARGDRTVLAWTTDGDGALTTNSDRRIATAIRFTSTSSWVITAPPELPTGADSPSVVFNNNGWPQLAFLVRGKDGDGVTDTGIGNQAILWSAYDSGEDDWDASVVQDELGQQIRAERPQLGTNNSGEMFLVFRRFGDTGTNAGLGQLMLTHKENYWNSFAPPLYLTDDGRQHWQQALTVNPSGEVLALSVSREALAYQGGPFPAGSQAARPTLVSDTLASGDDPLESLFSEAGADPALDPALKISQQHAAPGSTVVVSATIRNVGRASTSSLVNLAPAPPAPSPGQLVVNLYAGIPPTGTLLSMKYVAEDLAFNETHAVSFQVAASGGEQPLYAEVTSGDDDLGADNNIATVDLGELPPPTFVRAAVSTRYPNALEISWLPPLVEGIEGYRILRSQTLGGPYELVGEAMGTVYSDLLLERGTPYYYVVQTYDAHGVRSEHSTEVSGMLPIFAQYLPLVMRN